jgi:hypothetical protein
MNVRKEIKEGASRLAGQANCDSKLIKNAPKKNPSAITEGFFTLAGATRFELVTPCQSGSIQKVLV